jgi:hypothetical protein
MKTQTKKSETPVVDDKILSSIVTNGDLGKLSPDQKVTYYRNFCERLGLDPLSQPFNLLRLNGKEILYCGRAGAQQLSKLHNVSHEIKAREVVSGCYVVTAQASTPDGRRTESIGAVPVDNLKGDALCNAMMKAETKSKRRATLDLLGLGILDETETEALPATEVAIPVAQPAAPQTPTAEPVPATEPVAKAASEKAAPKREEAPEIVKVSEEEAASPFKQRYETTGEIEEALEQTYSLADITDLYYENEALIAGNTVLKSLFSARKSTVRAAEAGADSGL